MRMEEDEMLCGDGMAEVWAGRSVEVPAPHEGQLELLRLRGLLLLLLLTLSLPRHTSGLEDTVLRVWPRNLALLLTHVLYKVSSCAGQGTHLGGTGWRW